MQLTKEERHDLRTSAGAIALAAEALSKATTTDNLVWLDIIERQADKILAAIKENESENRN